jgi:hypothetical protein
MDSGIISHHISMHMGLGIHLLAIKQGKAAAAQQQTQR